MNNKASELTAAVKLKDPAREESMMQHESKNHTLWFHRFF